MDHSGLTAASPSHSNSDGGGWSSVVQNKKGKGKKKKMKNARTLSLQTFFSEHGGGGGCGGGGGSETEQGREELGGLPESAQPELSTEDLVVRESLLSYFCDVLKRLGPVRVHGPELASELNGLSEEGKELVGRHVDIESFIGLSSQLVIIDDLVCAKEDAERARKIALDSIVTTVAARTNKTGTSSVAPGPPSSSTLAPAAPSTVWNSQTPLTAAIKANAAAVSASSTPTTTTTAAAAAAEKEVDVDSWLQLPKVESLFNYDSGSSLGNFPGLSSQLGKPDLSSPPPTIQRSASASNSNGFTSRFGGLGTTSVAPAAPVSPFEASSGRGDSTSIESLNRRLASLTMNNTELMQQLVNKERQLQHFSKMIAPQEELTASNEKLKQELEEAKKEISRLRALIEAKDGERNKDKTPTPPPVSDNYLIISLQHQLESERLNSRNLKHQLELERAYSSKVTEKHNFLLNRFHSTGSGPLPGSPVGLGEPIGGSSSGSRQTDSFGLRGLLANTTSAFRDDSTTSRFTIGGVSSQGPPPSSSACFSGTSVLNKPPNSSTFSSSLHSSLSSSSPPLQLSGGNFSTSFGGSDLSASLRSDDFQRRLTGPSTRVVLPANTQSLVNSMAAQSNKQ